MPRRIREQVRVFDEVVLGGKFRQYVHKYFYPIEVSRAGHLNRCENRIIVSFEDSSKSFLNELCAFHNTDKGSLDLKPSDHAYADIYEMIFGNNRSCIRRVFECGIGSRDSTIEGFMGLDATPGASLRVWRDYFINAQIWGADIDNSVLFTEERISTGYLDQLDPDSIRGFWSDVMNTNPTLFDIMIDDGLHTPTAALNLFQNSIEFLQPEGTYVVEDLSFSQIDMFLQGLDQDSFNVFTFITHTRTRGLRNGTLVVIRRKCHDL